LETTVSELTRGIGEPSEISVVLKGQGERLHREQPATPIEYELLTHKRAGMLESLLITLPDRTAREAPTTHEGEEFFHVMEGTVTLRYGDEVFELNKGDSAHFNASIPHCFTNRGDQPAQVLCTFGADSKSGYCPNCSSKLFFLTNAHRAPGSPAVCRMVD
jgi:mannose-6-phosphate isomerase-like protein (cupin superfamily)